VPETYENPLYQSLRKRVTGFALTFVFLLAVALLLEGPWSSRRKAKPRRLILLSVVEPGDISKIFVKHKEDSVLLKRIQGIWFVFRPGDSVGYRADSAQVQRALDHLKDVEGEVVSTREDRYNLFEVNDSLAIQVAIWDKEGKEMGRLYIGKAGPDFSTTYVRSKDRKEVVLVEGFLRSYFFSNYDRWRNRKVISFDYQQTKKLYVRFPDGDTLLLERKDGKWYFAEGEEADSTKVIETLRYFSNLRALAFGDTLDPKRIGLGEEPEALVRATLFDGRTYILYVGKKTEKPERYPVMAEGDNSIYLVSTYTMGKILKPRKEYVKKEEKEKKPSS
jgi:hypothetical protein